MSDVARLIEVIRRFHAEGRLPTEVAGELLVAAGVQPLRAHPDEDDDIDTEDQDVWRDASDQHWAINLSASWADRNNIVWRWAGGWNWPSEEIGKQPLLRRKDYSEDEVPLCYVDAVAGPLRRM